jgi:fatty acid desaturase
MLPSAPRLTNQQREDGSMFLIVAIALVVLWVMGAFVFRVLGGLVHILLIIALIALVVHFVRGHP